MWIYLIFTIKIVFLILAFIHIYDIVKGKEGDAADLKIVYWKNRVEFIFSLMMSCLLIYLFYPGRGNKAITLDYETKLLLFLFGFILIITAKWSVFIKESKFVKKVKGSIN